MIQLYSANDLATMQGVKVLIYGRSGLGKTCLTATAPAPVLISAESGLLSLKKANLERIFGVNTPGICYDIPVIQVTTIEQLIEAEVWARTSQEAGYFQTVCIDSLTEIAEVVLANAKAQVKDPRQAYGELLEKMQTTIKAFRDLQGKHVYMCAKEERHKDELAGTFMCGPSMPGSKLGQGLPYYFDEVFHLGMGKNPDQTAFRYLRTVSDFTHEAKDRSGALDELEYPHLGNIFNKILSQTA